MQAHDDNFGNWQGLCSSREAPRYAAIGEMLRHANADRIVLDVGCGEGVLRSWLPKGADYLGIEPSALAIRNAIELNSSEKFIQTSAESYDARDRRFASIVFNEILYYAADPVGLVEKYAALLQPNGVILCSVFQRKENPSLKRRLRHFFDRRRPMSNIHCEKMVRRYMTRNKWRILEDREVGIWQSTGKWHIWLAEP